MESTIFVSDLDLDFDLDLTLTLNLTLTLTKSIIFVIDPDRVPNLTFDLDI